MSSRAASLIGSIPKFAAAALGLLLLLVCPALVLHAENPSEKAGEQELTPYQQALLHYQNGEYPEARTAIDAAAKSNPDDPATQILKARILTELLDFAAGQKLLMPLLSASDPLKAQLALGDLLLRKHDFGGASKYYEMALQAQPKDHDLILKVIYAKVGATDLVEAEKLASGLKPFDPHAAPLDPTHPGDPCYYFAKAAIAQATGKPEEADDEIETARTIFGITITNRYLKTYLEVTAPAKSPAAALAVPADAKPSSAAPVPATIPPKP